MGNSWLSEIFKTIFIFLGSCMGIKTKSENRKGNLNHFAAKSKQIDKLQIGTVTKLIH